MTRMVELATRYGRYGYRRITGLLRGEGWSVNHKRIERLWRREGLKVPQKQPKPWGRRTTVLRLSPPIASVRCDEVHTALREPFIQLVGIVGVVANEGAPGTFLTNLSASVGFTSRTLLRTARLSSHRAGNYMRRVPSITVASNHPPATSGGKGLEGRLPALVEGDAHLNGRFDVRCTDRGQCPFLFDPSSELRY